MTQADELDVWSKVVVGIIHHVVRLCYIRHGSSVSDVNVSQIHLADEIVLQSRA